MKRFAALLITLFTALSLHSSVSLIAEVNPALLYDSFPRFDLGADSSSDEYLKRAFYTTRQDVYYRYYERESFADIGFRIDDEHFRLIFDIDLRQTLNSFYRRNYYSNIPYRFDILNDILDLNFPRYAYGEINFDRFFLSIGRRPISWGPGTHQFTISRDVPFLDNIWAEYTTPLEKGRFTYNFVFISFNQLGLKYSAGAADEQKNLAAHRVEWNTGSFRLSIGELNLIYSRSPAFFDINPFTIYHNLYQEGSNVMAYIEGEGIINLGKTGALRLFAELEMDDYSLPTEDEKGKPTAFGAGIGIEWHIADGREKLTEEKKNEKYLLSSDTFAFTTGLNISYEFYFCNPYNYNRDVDAGKFTVPLHTDGNRDLYAPNALYLGFRYGPNTIYQSLTVEYISGRIEASSSLSLLIRGNGYTIDSPYGSSTIGTGEIDYNAVYTLNGESMMTILMDTSLVYLYAPGLQIEAGISGAFDLYNRKSAVLLTLGHRIDFTGL